MDTSVVSPDSNTSVYSSPDSANEPPKTEKFRTSISVSSLAEKFEKSADFSKSEEKRKNENEFDSQSQNERNESVADSNLQDQSDVFESNDTVSQQSAEKKDVKDISRISETENVNVIDKTESKEKEEHGEQVPLNANDDCIVVYEVRSDSSDTQVSTSVTESDGVENVQSEPQASFDIYTDAQVTKAVEERVAFFAGKISVSSQNVPSNVAAKKDNMSEEKVDKDSSVESISQISDATSLTMKHLEQSFVNALYTTNSNAIGADSTDTLSVPSIEITEASDREDSSSEDSEENKEIVRTEAKTTDMNKKESSNKKISDAVAENPTPSTSKASQCELDEKPEVSLEERKAIFYISSSDLPAESPKETSEDSDELRKRSVIAEGSTDPERTTQIYETKAPSCLCSKTVHGTIFVISFVVAIFGFILYSLAHEGRVPDFCSHLGLVTTILAGVIGAFSCFCYTCLEAFPGLQFCKYRKMTDAENTRPDDETTKPDDAQNLDESWSSEKEPALKKQSGMSSNRTSTSSLKSNQSDYLVIKQSDHKELVDKTEKLKTEVMKIIDSFSEIMSQLQPLDEVAEMESGMADS